MICVCMEIKYGNCTDLTYVCMVFCGKWIRVNWFGCMSFISKSTYVVFEMKSGHLGFAL